MGLFWKKTFIRTFVTKDVSVASEHKHSKHQLTLLLGGNLACYLKLKQLLIYQTGNPRALKRKDKKLLPSHLEIK